MLPVSNFGRVIVHTFLTLGTINVLIIQKKKKKKYPSAWYFNMRWIELLGWFSVTKESEDISQKYILCSLKNNFKFSFSTPVSCSLKYYDIREESLALVWKFCLNSGCNNIKCSLSVVLDKSSHEISYISQVDGWYIDLLITDLMIYWFNKNIWMDAPHRNRLDDNEIRVYMWATKL